MFIYMYVGAKNKIVHAHAHEYMNYNWNVVYVIVIVIIKQLYFNKLRVKAYACVREHVH